MKNEFESTIFTVNILVSGYLLLVSTLTALVCIVVDPLTGSLAGVGVDLLLQLHRSTKLDIHETIVSIGDQNYRVMFLSPYLLIFMLWTPRDGSPQKARRSSR